MIKRLMMALVLPCLVVATGSGHAEPTLLESLPGPDPVADLGADSVELVRRRGIKLNKHVLRDLKTTAPGTNLRLNLFDDVNYGITLKERKQTRDGFTWHGRVKGQPLADFTLAAVGDAVAADLRLPGGKTFSIRTREGGIHEVREILEVNQAPCGNKERHNNPTATGRGSAAPAFPQAPADSSTAAGDPTLAPSAAAAASDAGDEIDVMICYTPGAKTQAGGYEGMQALINLAIANANQAYANSLIDLTVSKVHTYEVNYTADASDMGVDVDALQDPEDGLMDEVHTLRDTYKADLVALFVPAQTGGCGVGFIMNSSSINTGFASYGFSAVANTCVNTQTLAHEMGHNMGCAHDRDNASPQRAYAYSYGWRWNGTSSGTPQYRSVMAYAPGSRVKYFSNPNVSYDGTATGTDTNHATPAYNALTITNTKSVVANFRERGATGPIISASPDSVTASVIEGNNAAAGSLSIANSGNGTLNYTITDTVSWLSVSAASGSAASGTTNTHSIVYDTSALSPGTTSAIILIADSGAMNTPYTIAVTLTVQAGAPDNDNFADAQVIAGGGGSVSGTTVNSTRESGEPATIDGAAGSHSIWYKWTSPGTGVIVFTTTGSSFDTLLGAYTGTLGSLTQVAANDQGSGLGDQSEIGFGAVSGTTYYILIDGWEGATGTTVLNWTGSVPVTLSAVEIE